MGMKKDFAGWNKEMTIEVNRWRGGFAALVQ